MTKVDNEANLGFERESWQVDHALTKDFDR